MKLRSRKNSILLMSLVIFFSSNILAQVTYRKLAFKDEFNKKANSPIDTAKWTVETGGWGWGNQELQYYANSAENAYHDGKGSLIIKAAKLPTTSTLDCWYGKCQYTSARLVTKQKFEQKHGRIEARIKIPGGKGMWAAFWMLGNDIDTNGWSKCGEIDIMENIGREPSTVHGTIHGPGYEGANGISGNFELANGEKFSDAFHVYRVDWSENKIQWYVDGKLYQTLTPANLPPGKEWVYEHPFFMILNLAIGGAWGGNPDNDTVFPGVMMVDYVRVYSR